MVMKLTDIKKLFSKEGLRFTTQRQIVFDILRSENKPLTADDIYMRYIKQDHTISLSTIYRILEVFVDKAIVNKSHLTDENKAYFVLNHHEHQHYFVCTSCKKVIDIKECPFHTIEKEIENKTDFVITGHKFELYGYCKECQ